MGHDITGYSDAACDHEVAYLRRGAFNEIARAIYIALGATEHDCGCSGCGTVAYFSRTALEGALQKLPIGEEYEPERKFINDMLAKSGVGAWVTFS